MTGSVSFESLRFLAIHDLSVTLLRWNKTVLSTILTKGPSNGELRVAQVEANGGDERRFKVAREFIREQVAKRRAAAAVRSTVEMGTNSSPRAGGVDVTLSSSGHRPQGPRLRRGPRIGFFELLLNPL